MTSQPTIELFNEDCLEGMKRLPDDSIDFILTDLPYGITNCDFDVRIPFEPMWQQFKRVTKRNAAIALFSQMPFGAELIMSNRKMFRYEIIWEKNFSAGFLNAHKMPLRCHENILLFYSALPTYNPQFIKAKPYKMTKNFISQSQNYGAHAPITITDTIGRRFPNDVIYCERISNSVGATHPQQKPTALLEYLIRTYTNEGETVLDATMGSGSTGVAAVNTGRNFVGFELEEKFFDVAQKRIDDALAEREQRLFA